MDRVADWIALVDSCYPEADAEGWDAVGLHVGAPDDEVSGVLVCLDVTGDTLDEAAATGCDLVLAHHPLLFRPLHRLTPATAAGLLALRAARAGLAVAAAHTNLDVAPDGTTAPIVELLALGDVTSLEPSAGSGEGRVKLVTFVPAEDLGRVLGAVAAAGAGVIGEYDMCSFRVSGTGTFRPSAAAHPAIGDRGTLNEVAEHRLEIVVDRPRIAEAVAALVDAHPYEEVAYDLYPLLPAASAAGAKGHGAVGDLPEPLALGEIARRLSQGLPSPWLRLAGDPARVVRRVAACGGAGDSLIGAALAARAELYVTGDLRHHPALDATTLGLAVIDAGHYATEIGALKAFRDRLATAAEARGLQARLVPSAVPTEPWREWRADKGAP